MMICPQCGESAPDGARFCDRCGQGLEAKDLSPPAPTLTPLAADTTVGGRYVIVELLTQTRTENRYRVAEHPANDTSGPVYWQLREASGPTAAPAQPEADWDRKDEAGASPAEGSGGPEDKTAELPPLPSDAAGEAGSQAEAAEHADSPSGAAPNESSPDGETSKIVLTEAMLESAGSPQQGDELAGGSAVPAAAAPLPEQAPSSESKEPTDGAASPGVEVLGTVTTDQAADLGDVFGRVLALSLTVNHPAFLRAVSGFADSGRVYLVYPDEKLMALARRDGGPRMSEAEALNVTIQVCQAVSVLHRRGLRVNDICPESVAIGADGRARLTGLDYVSNDLELQASPIYNDGYTAPEIYRARKVDKRADVFSIGALLYTCLTGERLECESWREEAGPVVFYPRHVVVPELEKVVRKALAFDPEARWATVDQFKTELSRLNSRIELRAAVLTDVGMVRELNEDSVLALEYRRASTVEPAQSFLYVVADGMGGAAAGETASAIAVEAVRDYVTVNQAGSAAADRRELLKNALEEANRRIIAYQANHPESHGMGSTGVCALIVPPEADVAWVGDSRAYLLSGGTLRQITRDHSLVQRLVEIGQITPEEARHHEHKNVITRSLGARDSGMAGAEATGARLKRGDRLLLCSDGLVAHVEDREIAGMLSRHDDPVAAGRELIVAANAGGGTDNITVAVIFAD